MFLLAYLDLVDLYSLTFQLKVNLAHEGVTTLFLGISLYVKPM